VVCVGRVAAVFTENVNWDEFALLHRAELSAATGELIGGGRPGLATLLLLPLASDCRDALSALVQARLFWTALVLASVVAFLLLLRQVLPASPHKLLALVTGVGLWCLSPPFLRFSTQVRTDQPAVLFGLLGGLTLVASRQNTVWAIASGLLFGIGFLFTQKLLYVAALVGVLAAGELFIRADWKFRRETVRVLLTGAAFLLVVIGYRELMTTRGGEPSMLPLARSLNTFQHYREAVGWGVYGDMLPMLVPQIMTVMVLPMAAAGWMRQRGATGRELAVACGVMLLGSAIILFHAARFPYFYIVLGLFPATIGALVIGPVLDLLPTVRSRHVFVVLIWAPLALLALLQTAQLLGDDQSHQRASLAFVERNFSAEAHGFNPRAAFACRQEARPFPTWFHEQVRARFEKEPEATENTRWILEEFRARPVAFMIPPGEGEPYPAELWNFWKSRYVHYSGAVHVPGRQVRGRPGFSDAFEVIVPGEYVWRSSAGSGPLAVAGSMLDPGAAIEIDEPGTYPIGLPEGGEGLLVLSLADPPAPDPRPFYTGW
jgi:hypothetical protein